MLTGRMSGELATAVGQDDFNADPKAVGKTGVGHLVEWFLGKPPNSSDEPDIPELGIEVKTIPLELRGKGIKSLGPKEPTSLTMIDFARVAEQEWNQAYVRKKLQRILWVPYVHDYDDKRLHSFREPFLWTPPEGDLPQYEEDYGIVRTTIREGRPHELSEQLSVVLAARRKGQKGSTTTYLGVKASTRAWALKSAYTGTLLNRQQGLPALSILELAEQARQKRGKEAGQLRLADVRTLDQALRFVLQEFRQFEGLTTKQIGARLSSPLEKSKNRHSAMVRSIIGLPRRGNVEELEKLGVRLHVLDVDADDSRPFEGIPFPAMVLRTFSEEEWEDSQLAEHVDRIIFVPTFSKTGALDEPHQLGRAFLWQPTREDWGIIEDEWTTFQGYVRRCDMESMPTGKATRRIHMRPHGRTAADIDVDPCGHVVTKQCFWLNQDFVQSILKD